MLNQNNLHYADGKAHRVHESSLDVWHITPHDDEMRNVKMAYDIVIRPEKIINGEEEEDGASLFDSESDLESEYKKQVSDFLSSSEQAEHSLARIDKLRLGQRNMTISTSDTLDRSAYHFGFESIDYDPSSAVLDAFCEEGCFIDEWSADTSSAEKGLWDPPTAATAMKKKKKQRRRMKKDPLTMHKYKTVFYLTAPSLPSDSKRSLEKVKAALLGLRGINIKNITEKIKGSFVFVQPVSDTMLEIHVSAPYLRGFLYARLRVFYLLEKVCRDYNFTEHELPAQFLQFLREKGLDALLHSIH